MLRNDSRLGPQSREGTGPTQESTNKKSLIIPVQNYKKIKIKTKISLLALEPKLLTSTQNREQIQGYFSRRSRESGTGPNTLATRAGWPENIKCG